MHIISTKSFAYTHIHTSEADMEMYFKRIYKHMHPRSRVCANVYQYMHKSSLVCESLFERLYTHAHTYSCVFGSLFMYQYMHKNSLRSFLLLFVAMNDWIVSEYQ